MTRNILHTVFLGSLLFNLNLIAQTTTLTETSGFSSPESVISDGKFLYVSNIGVKPKPTIKDTDGFISKLSLKGELMTLKFIAGLDAPKGMSVIGNNLYVTNIDHVKGFDLGSGKETFDLSFESEKISFLNDLCVRDEKHLFVSASDGNCIYEIDLPKKSFSKVKLNFPLAEKDQLKPDSLMFPNGVWYNKSDGKLYIATMSGNGKIFSVIFGKGKNAVTEICGEPGLYDGLFMNGKTLLVSDWCKDRKGKIKMLDMKTKKLTELKFEGREDFSGAADFYYDDKTKMIWIPEMLTGKVSWGKLNL